MQRSAVLAFVGVVLASAMLFLFQKALSQSPSKDLFQSIYSANWHYTDNDRELVRPIRLGSGLSIANSDLSDCCRGTYHFIIPPTMIERVRDSSENGDEYLALYISTIGGKHSITINGKPYSYSSFEPSSIGPLIPISIDSSKQLNTIYIAVSIDGPANAYAGIWRDPVLFGSFDDLDNKRQTDLLHQVAIPLFFVVFAIILSLLFAYLYIFTDKQFPSYGLFSISLLPIAVFQLMLSGLPRKMDIWLASVMHYPARLLEGLGIFILLTCFVAHINEESDLQKFKKLISFRTIFLVLLLGAATLLVLNISGIWVGPNIVSAVLYMLAFYPVLFWPLRDMSVRSLNFLGFVIVAMGAIGGILDGAKYIYRTLNIIVPYDYFTRITTPLVVGTTVLVSATHFRRFYLNHQKALASAARDSAIAQTMQMVAHDARKPFSLLKNILSWLNQERLPVETKKRIQSAEFQVDRALRSVNAMVEDLMSFGGEVKLFREILNPESLFQEAISMLSYRLDDSKVQMKFEYKHNFGTAVDKSKMIRVLTNIIENALQATPNGGLVRITTEDSRNSKFVTLSVNNSGSFISAIDRKQVFESFFSKNKANGTGLGLAIAKRFVEAHGGEISCESTLDLGTTFLIQLPASKLEGGDSSALDSAKEHLFDDFKGSFIAVVDDDPFLLEASEYRFAPFKVKTFDCPQSFWKAFSSNEWADFACVVTDFIFDNAGPDENGLSFAKECAASLPNVPVFLCSDFELTAVELAVFAGALPKTGFPGKELQRILSSKK